MRHAQHFDIACGKASEPKPKLARPRMHRRHKNHLNYGIIFGA